MDIIYGAKVEMPLAIRALGLHRVVTSLAMRKSDGSITHRVHQKQKTAC